MPELFSLSFRVVFAYSKKDQITFTYAPYGLAFYENLCFRYALYERPHGVPSLLLSLIKRPYRIEVSMKR